MKTINIEENKVAIIATKEYAKEAERLFMKLVDMKEAQDSWYCSNHSYTNRGGAMKRVYLFKKDGSHDIDALYLLVDYELKGVSFDHVISYGVPIPPTMSTDVFMERE